MATAQPVVSDHLPVPHEHGLAQGLRQVRLWVLDVSTQNFRDEAHRQSQAVAASPHEDEDQAFIDAISALDDGGEG